MTDISPERWKTCQQGSCRRNNGCMYTPCSNAPPTPAPATLTPEQEAVIQAAQDVVYHHFAPEMRSALILAVEAFLAATPKPDPRIAIVRNWLLNGNTTDPNAMAKDILAALDAAGRDAT